MGLFPGSFDPLTNGHLDVIHRGRHLFDELVVAIGRNPAKREVFSVDERIAMIGRLVAGTNVRVDAFAGLTVDYARDIGAVAILRGIRNVTDLNFEFQLALTNRAIADVETVFIMTGEVHAFTSSTLIKQIASAGDTSRLAKLLPPEVLEKLEEKKRALGGKLPWRHVDQAEGT
ncbi:phosphopantetheine adenylyltransferase [Phycisphaera mikurensis NBRC 102666]|uniref:Phosphopantetheine adenylyltransferase n=1 Tax=Phycisphaera mikurensis (strain NBRC 102666 / KCTC 22515 / FYK2301M01) TaxID=1142394 RepID=I0IGA2_PHYMF|nr:phosphopantetheine adenylyltransferase [Phycisphaera mikurensis NBRC 102666]